MIKRVCLLILLAIVLYIVLRIYVDRQFVDFDCINFKNREEAMEKFKENTYDKYGLDANHNGIPCEILPE